MMKTQETVQVRCIDPYAGLYRALSSDGRTWYAVDVRARTCSCPAGAYKFAGVKSRGGQCRHLVAARAFARGLAGMTPADRENALRLQNVRVHVDRIDHELLELPVGQGRHERGQENPHRGSARGLLEAFS